MANVERFLYGHPLYIRVPVESATVIEKGDFVCLVSDYAVNIATIATADGGADVWIGIAADASGAGETDPIRVDISELSVYNLTQQTAAEIHVGDTVETYVTGGACADQLIVEGSTDPIAICVEEKGASGTDVKCKLLPSKLLHVVNT